MLEDMSTSQARDVESRARAAEKDLQDARSKNDAFDAAVRAAELYMQALGLSDNSRDKQRLDKKFKELLCKGEYLKQQIIDHPISVRLKYKGYNQRCFRTGPANPTEPSSSRELSKRERIILLEGSKLNGFKFPIWTESPDPKLFELQDGETRFTDSPPLSLSPNQLEVFAGWKRPEEAFSNINIMRGGQRLSNTPTMKRNEKIDLVQDLTSDCSIVASLCAGAARAERGHSKILASVMGPYDHENRCPAISKSGRYVLRLHFNGCNRRVEIDDLLPTSKNSRLLHVIDRINPGYLWPALLEKAYLKVRGGYDFSGSNSGTDIAVFTGWIPEQIFLHQGDILPDDLWNQIHDGFVQGNLLLTLGTGKLSRRDQKSLGLAAEHDYAVLDLKETNRAREVLIKNPWAEGATWTGAARQKPHSASSEIDTTGDQDLEMVPGTFWMEFDSIFLHFDNFFLNWDPKLFLHRKDIHFTWDLEATDVAFDTFENNPQFAITSATAGDVWVLLNRHLKTGDYLASQRHTNGYIELNIFQSNGQRVLVKDKAEIRGPYVDSPNTLLKFPMPADATFTIVVDCDDFPPSTYNFTISAFTDALLELTTATSKYPSIYKMHSAWTRSTAGGNADSPSFLSNPQFSIQLSVKTSLAIILSPKARKELTLPTIMTKLFVVFSGGSRVNVLRSRDVVAGSGDYRNGSAIIETTLDKGSYTIICSTFEKDQLCKFILSTYTSLTTPIVPKQLPSEMSGRLRIKPPIAVFNSDTSRLLTPLRNSRLTRSTFIARHAHSSECLSAKTSSVSRLKISVERGQGPYKFVIATSATDDHEFADASGGVRLEDIDLQPSQSRQDMTNIWLVVERMLPGSQVEHPGELVEVEMLTEERIDFGPWGHGDG